MSRQYNMYNVQLSEFWKQRCTKEGIHNAPYLFDEENDDTISEAPSRAVSQLSTTSTVTQQKIEELQKKLEAERAYASSPRPLPPQPCAHPRLQKILLVGTLQKALAPPRCSYSPPADTCSSDRRKRIEVEQMLASFQQGKQ